MAGKMHIPLPKSPTAIVVMVTLGCVVAMLLWTGYMYFLAPPPIAHTIIAPTQFYNSELKSISEELKRFDAYQIDLSAPVDIGKDDPFGGF